MGYYRGDSLIVTIVPRLYPTQFEKNWKCSFLSVYAAFLCAFGIPFLYAAFILMGSQTVWNLMYLLLFGKSTDLFALKVIHVLWKHIESDYI